MKVFNSLSRKIEDFVPIREGKVGMYTCGPTVYSTPTIANFRTYVLGDLIVRTFRHLGYDVNYVMNITDVGHLTGDNEGDADIGEDRLEKAAKKEGRTAWDVAREYTSEFLRHMDSLNIQKPDQLCKATDHIAEQIALVKKIEMKGYTYKTSDGVYFDTVEYESMGGKYGELSTLDERREGARVEVNPEKKDLRDFALWKLSLGGERRQMEWESPWGVGFPGWHVECSAMSMKYLGEQFDVHVGGEDLRSTHHPNEIAQSEAATGKRPFVKYWVHGAFLLVDGGRMGKSLGNAYTVEDLVGRGYDPLALRYLYLTGHYRKQLNFTWESLDAAAVALSKLRGIYRAAESENERTVLSEEKLAKLDGFRRNFEEMIGSDFDFPQALSVMWQVAKSNVPGRDKAETLLEMDQVMGVGVDKSEDIMVPEEVVELAEKREEARKAGDFDKSDLIRDEMRQAGYEVLDLPGGFKIEKSKNSNRSR